MSNESAVSLAAPVNLVTTGEITILSGPAIPYNAPGGQGIRVSGAVNVTTGTGTTGVTVRVRQGVGVSGTLVGGAQLDAVAAGASATIAFDVVDANPVAAGAQYTVTVQQANATGNGTCNFADLGQTAVTAAG